MHRTSENKSVCTFRLFYKSIGNIITEKEVQDEVGYECYDIVVANILADVLVPLTPVIVNQMKPGSLYITSGIIDDKEQTVVDAVKAAGILKDKDDPASLIPCIDTNEAKALFADGTISGGMIPKVECCIEAIEKGVRRVTILDGRVPHALLLELLTDEGAGTLVKGMD